jgi:putative transcriptional regulator
VDVRGLRKRLRLSQGRFADNFGLSVDAVRHWESGRSQPEAAARVKALQFEPLIPNEVTLAAMKEARERKL